MRLFGLILARWIIVSAAFKAPGFGNFKVRPSLTSLRMVSERITAMQALMDFNRDFKAGLKFILIPQYELKEKAKAAMRAKRALEASADIESIDFDSAAPIDSAPLPNKNLDSLIQAITDPIPDLSPSAGLSESDTISSSGTSVTSGLSIPDISILRETLENALPDRSPIEIREMTSRLAEITAAVQERTQQLTNQAALAKLGSGVHDMSSVVNEQYQQVLPFVTETVKDISRIINENYQQAQPYVSGATEEISRAAMENYERAQPYVTEAKNEISRLITENVQPYVSELSKDISDTLNDKYQQAVPYVNDISKEVVDVSYMLNEKYQKAILDILAVDSEPSQILADLKERILSMEFQYKLQYRADHMPDITYVPTIPYDKFDAVFDSLNLLIQTDGWTLSDLLQSLNYQELGGWYSGAIVGVFFVASLTMKSKTPPMELTARAPKVAKSSKSRVSSVRTSISSSTAADVALNEEKMRLENLVSDLTIAVTALSRELKELKVDKAKTEHALATMKSDVRTLQNAIYATDLTERQLKKHTLESAKMEADLQMQLEEAEKKVKSLETEKQNLQSEINMLTNEAAEIQIKPKPPSTPPPQQNLTGPKGSGVWFANFISNTTS